MQIVNASPLILLARGPDYFNPEPSDHLRPTPTWNEMAIAVRDQAVQVTLNRQVIQDFNLNRFADRPNALPSLKRRSGRVGFQSHTGTVRFRNIEIKELDRSGKE